VFRSDTDRPGKQAPTARQTAVQLAQLELLSGNLPGIIGGTLLTCLIMTVAMYEVLSIGVLLLWVAAIVALSVVRTWHLVRLRRNPPTAANADRCQAQLTGLSVANAAVWGVFGYLAITPEHPTQTLAVVMVLSGLVASATGFISHLRTMYISYIFAMMGPAAIRCLSFGDQGFTIIAVLIVLYLVVSLSASRATARTVLTSINTRFDNLDQYAELLEEKALADEAKLSAELANAAKSQFLSSASHDLRQPLHSLRLFSATLLSRMSSRQDVADDKYIAEDQRLVRRMDESVTALEGLFEGILDLSRLDAGTYEEQIEHSHLQPIFDQIELAFEPGAKVKNLVFKQDANELVVKTDPQMLGRMLSNLVANAIRYTDEGSVELSAQLNDELVVIKVNDTGIGIPAEEHARVFEEFVQLDNPERDRHQGVGLGLSIVKRLADILDIEIAIETGQDFTGTSFVLFVPVGESTEVTVRTAKQLLPAKNISGLFILIIDDEQSARDALEGLVQGWGATAMLASSRTEALEALAEIDEVPDIVISDYRLRDSETGTGAIKAVREQVGRDIAALLITGDIEAHRLQDINLSGLPVLHKPCNPEKLKESIIELTR
jgi:signal transduction histidine kinase/CheY-like chemotaxis protein